MKAKEKPPKSDVKTSDFSGFCLMALTKSPARRPVTSRGTRILRRGFPACTLRPPALLRLPVSAAGGGRLRSNSSYGSCGSVPRPAKRPVAGRDPYGNLPRAALSRTAAPASCGAVSRLHSAAAGPAPAPCFRRRRRSPAQQFLVWKLRICSTACKKARGRA